MKLIESKAELVLQQEGLEGVYKQIELAGRTAYHSLDKITPDSAKDFVDRMIKSKHGAALEHGTVYLKVPTETWREDEHEWVYMFPEELPWVSLDCDGKYWYITTNFRHILEGNVGIKTMNKYLCSPTDSHEKRYTMRFTCSRAIAQELTRHRVFSFLMESQRYINYSKERHGGEITFIKPSWYDKYSKVLLDSTGHRLDGTSDMFTSEDDFEGQLRMAEGCYMAALIAGVKPQEARDVLPNATKTELNMTGFASDWRFFFDLRYYGETGKPHPDMELLASKARSEFMKAGLWDNIMACPTKFDKDGTEGKD